MGPQWRTGQAADRFPGIKCTAIARQRWYFRTRKTNPDKDPGARPPHHVKEGPLQPCPICGATLLPHPTGIAWCPRGECGYETATNHRPPSDDERKRFTRRQYWMILDTSKLTYLPGGMILMPETTPVVATGTAWEGEDVRGMGLQMAEIRALPTTPAVDGVERPDGSPSTRKRWLF